VFMVYRNYEKPCPIKLLSALERIHKRCQK
jgi:hypothetical protein